MCSRPPSATSRVRSAVRDYSEPFFRQPGIFLLAVSCIIAIFSNPVIQKHSRPTSGPSLDSTPSQPYNVTHPAFFFELCAQSQSPNESVRASGLIGRRHYLNPPSHRSAPSTLLFTPYYNNQQQLSHRGSTIYPSSPTNLLDMDLQSVILHQHPPPKGRGGNTFLASVQAGLTPTDLLVRAGNKSHQTTALQGPHLSATTIASHRGEVYSSTLVYGQDSLIPGGR